MPSSSASISPRTSTRCARSRPTRHACPRWGSATPTTRRSPACTRRRRPSPAVRCARWTRSSMAKSSTPSTPAAGCTTRCRTGRRASASTTTRRWRSCARVIAGCGSCTWTSTCTTAMASRRSASTIQACSRCRSTRPVAPCSRVPAPCRSWAAERPRERRSTCRSSRLPVRPRGSRRFVRWSRRSPPCSGPTSWCRSTARTRMPGTRSRTWA